MNWIGVLDGNAAALNLSPVASLEQKQAVTAHVVSGKSPCCPYLQGFKHSWHKYAELPLFKLRPIV